jgi:hypothetical protein
MEISHEHGSSLNVEYTVGAGLYLLQGGSIDSKGRLGGTGDGSGL